MIVPASTEAPLLPLKDSVPVGVLLKELTELVCSVLVEIPEGAEVPLGGVKPDP